MIPLDPMNKVISSRRKLTQLSRFIISHFEQKLTEIAGFVVMAFFYRDGSADTQGHQKLFYLHLHKLTEHFALDQKFRTLQSRLKFPCDINTIIFSQISSLLFCSSLFLVLPLTEILFLILIKRISHSIIFGFQFLQSTRDISKLSNLLVVKWLFNSLTSTYAVDLMTLQLFSIGVSCLISMLNIHMQRAAHLLQNSESHNACKMCRRVVWQSTSAASAALSVDNRDLHAAVRSQLNTLLIVCFPLFTCTLLLEISAASQEQVL